MPTPSTSRRSSRWPRPGPAPTEADRLKFGDDPAKHRDFSAVTHVARGKGIPPFLILHVAEHPDTGAQARRMRAALEAAGVPVEVVGARGATHASINDNLGVPDDPTSTELFAFVRRVLAPVR